MLVGPVRVVSRSSRHNVVRGGSQMVSYRSRRWRSPISSALITLSLALAHLAIGCGADRPAPAGDPTGNATDGATDPSPSPSDGPAIDAGSTTDGGGVGVSDAANDSGDGGILQVQGTVVYNEFRQPLGGATVTINGVSVTTNAAGEFAVANVTAPYDVRIAHVADGAASYEIFEGLTAAKPTLVVATFMGGAVSSATVSGVVKRAGNGTFPVPAGNILRVFRPAPDATTVEIPFDPATGAFSTTLQWRGGISPHPGRIHALEYTADAQGWPTSWVGNGTLIANVTNGQTTANKTLSMIPLQTVTKTVTILTPEPTGPVTAGYSVAPEYHAWLEWTKPATATASFPIPSQASDSIFVRSSFTGGGGGTSQDALSWPDPNITLDLRTSLSPSPADGSTWSPTSKFTWAPRPGVFNLVVRDASSRVALRVLTTKTEAAWPAGVTPPSGTYQWTLENWPRATSMSSINVTGISYPAFHVGLRPAVRSTTRTLTVP